MNKEFWKGKRVFLTGHTGFKGSWLSLWLQQLGVEVTGFALPPETTSLYHIGRVAGGMRSILGDIRDAEVLQTAIKEAEPEIVIHMAAQALVRTSYALPVDTYATNVMGSIHLLEAVRQIKGVRAVLMVTSDKCYENKEWEWGYRETEPMGGHDPYSSSKACAELATSAYRSSFFPRNSYENHGVAIATVRAGNVIGGGDWATDRLIPDIMRAIHAGKPVKIRNPHAIRPWQHVLEPLCGYLILIENLYFNGMQYAEAWNFGAIDEDAKPVQWIVEKMIHLWGEEATWELDVAHHVHEANYLKLDCSKAKAKLGWKPRWSLEKSLENIVHWHKKQKEKQDMREVTLQQIASFFNLDSEKCTKEYLL